MGRVWSAFSTVDCGVGRMGSSCCQPLSLVSHDPWPWPTFAEPHYPCSAWRSSLPWSFLSFLVLPAAGVHAWCRWCAMPEGDKRWAGLAKIGWGESLTLKWQKLHFSQVERHCGVGWWCWVEAKEYDEHEHILRNGNIHTYIHTLEVPNKQQHIDRAEGRGGFNPSIWLSFLSRRLYVC